MKKKIKKKKWNKFPQIFKGETTRVIDHYVELWDWEEEEWYRVAVFGTHNYYYDRFMTRYDDYVVDPDPPQPPEPEKEKN